MCNLANLDICFLAGTLGQGGAERQLFFMIKVLSERGAKVRLLCLTANEFWQNRIEALGVPVTWVGQDRSHLKRLSRIVAHLRRTRTTILQSQHFYCNAYASAAARLLGLREIGAMRNDGTSEVRDCGVARGWLNLHAPRMLAANSRAAINYAHSRNIPAARLFFLPNVVDTDHSTLTRQRCNPPTLVITGRLVKQKRIDRFLNVLARVRANPALKGQKVNAIVVGTGPRKAELEAQAQKLGLWPHAVEFRGCVDDVAAVYREAAVCVLTSDHEGTPNVLLEAMAAGLPVVATNVGGVPDLIRHGETGFLCDPADEAGLTGALVRLLQDPALRSQMGASAQRFVAANHALALLPDFLGALYHKRMSGFTQGRNIPDRPGNPAMDSCVHPVIH